MKKIPHFSNKLFQKSWQHSDLTIFSFLRLNDSTEQAVIHDYLCVQCAFIRSSEYDVYDDVSAAPRLYAVGYTLGHANPLA